MTTDKNNSPLPAPIDVTDPWRGLYLATRLPAPTEYGDIAHPDIPCWPDDREDALDKLVHAQGFDFQIVAGEFTEAALEDGDELYWEEMRAWTPVAPAEGEWRLAWKGDTEDGPYAWFVRPMALRPDPVALAATGKQQVGAAHPDDVAVDAFAAAMKAKMADARAKGRGGWEDPAQCSAHDLSRLLRDHVEKGDPRDVANFCMMLWNRQEGIATQVGKVQGGALTMIGSNLRSILDLASKMGGGAYQITVANIQHETNHALQFLEAALAARSQVCGICAEVIQPDALTGTTCGCARPRRAGKYDQSAEDRFEQFVQAEIARSPDALRELGEYLCRVLDEDEFPQANSLLLQLATEYADPPAQGIVLVPAGWTIVRGEGLRIVGPIEGPGGMVLDKPGRSLESRLLYALATALIDGQRDAAPGVAS